VHSDDFKQLADLAKFPTPTKEDLRGLSLRIGIFGAEPRTDSMRTEIE
jgi:phenylacetate-coenzyme A ligase PaaK-like adenylate-forming protein